MRKTPAASRTKNADAGRRRIPAGIRDPLLAGLILLAPVLAALLVHRAWVVPSYGPTAYLVATNPRNAASRPYNVIVGHLLGMAAGFLALAITGALSAPSVFATPVPIPGRLWACPLAIVLDTLFGYLLRAHHPPSAATTLIVTLGIIHNRADVISFLAGLAILVVVGEAVRSWRLGKFAPGFPREERGGEQR